MKKICFFAALLTCQSCENSPQLSQLRIENHALKIRLAALGQDTTVVGTALAGSSSLPVDTSSVITPAVIPTSTWVVKHYVNDFGDETKQGYITNAVPILGTFSNSATQDSPLIVEFLFDSKSMCIQLYEYARNNPVKSYGSKDYSVKFKDKDGKTYRLHATNYESDRMRLDKSSSSQLNAALLKGGKVQFVITEDDSPTEYRFTIDNAEGYSAARKELMGGK